jgi:hypothetical protein
MTMRKYAERLELAAVERVTASVDGFFDNTNAVEAFSQGVGLSVYVNDIRIILDLANKALRSRSPLEDNSNG